MHVKTNIDLWLLLCINNIGEFILICVYFFDWFLIDRYFSNLLPHFSSTHIYVINHWNILLLTYLSHREQNLRTSVTCFLHPQNWITLRIVLSELITEICKCIFKAKKNHFDCNSYSLFEKAMQNRTRFVLKLLKAAESVRTLWFKISDSLTKAWKWSPKFFGKVIKLQP